MDMQPRYRVLVRTARSVQAVMADGISACLALPRLTPLEQTAPCVLGAFDLRGELVPVISVGLLLGERTPRAAPSDLVLVVSVAAFPLGLHSARPLNIQALSPLTAGTPRRGAIDLRDLRLTATELDSYPDAEARLARFEQGLTRQALRRLEQRAGRYGEFAAGQAASTPAAAPARS
ncbi:MAG: chemotaxis protein CheW [Thiohalocapsa sp.]|jgi:hypothetical protein|uniref:chemotaxis protein CheW n=1 Tax=Thiohalocapsa sp. TaxID=2497641 RepID=UPI0025CB799A|nr:chemotaxis protein CheW [Thiohalocapsa sp.]MCG6940438.1 chemotaxis protein CheW [Thiohalocapsa sp.]